MPIYLYFRQLIQLTKYINTINLLKINILKIYLFSYRCMSLILSWYKNLKTLSKIEMKNVIDGLMDKDTTLEYCIEHNTPAPTGNSYKDGIRAAVVADMCLSNWERITS